MQWRWPEFMNIPRIRWRNHDWDQRTNYSGSYVIQLSRDLQRILICEDRCWHWEKKPSVLAEEIFADLLTKL